MGTTHPFTKVKLFCGFIYGDNQNYQAVKKELESIFSRIDLESEEFFFSATSYYFKEMNQPLYKRFVSFTDLIPPPYLSEVKLTTNQIEKKYASGNNRTVNLDPGYLSEANVVVATTKNHYHRIPLSSGIYAHMEYVIKKKQFVSLDWTYPDFRTQDYQVFFTSLKDLYQGQRT